MGLTLHCLPGNYFPLCLSNLRQATLIRLERDHDRSSDREGASGGNSSLQSEAQNKKPWNML